MNHVRIVGDPFGEDATGSAVRAFLHKAIGSGLECALALTAVAPRSVEAGQRAIALTDGVRNFTVGTNLPGAEIELLVRAGERAVAATAPVIVFAPEAERSLAVRAAGLAFPRATTVLSARDAMTAADLLERVRAELRWSGIEHPPHALRERELAPFLLLPPPNASGPVVFVGREDDAGGLAALQAAWPEFAASGRTLRLVLSAGGGRFRAVWPANAAIECAVGPLQAVHLQDAAVVLVAPHGAEPGRDVVLALASGRPVAAVRAPEVAAVIARAGICWPIGGRLLTTRVNSAATFAPEPAAMAAALRQALAMPDAGIAMGKRARQWVGEECTAPRPAAPPPPAVPHASVRPIVVIEAPLFETSSSAELSLATASALHRRGNVDLRLVPTPPLRGSLAAFRARAPELEPLLSREPGRADFWLCSGWPARSTRPDCRSWALRVDWEYGALPWELTPHVSQLADVVVVHSPPVQRLIVAAGRAADTIAIVPHGVDDAMHEGVEADPELLAWKAGRPAVLFCGGMIWRKGFDLFLRAVLEAQRGGQRPCVVIKTVGHDQHYGHFHLGELVERCQRTKSAPPIRVIDRELSRAELARVYAACDLLLHPYRGEGFGLPVLEARAAGLPVLATADGATDPLMIGPGALRLPAAPRPIDLPGAHVGAPWVLEPDAAATGRMLGEALANLPTLRREARAFAPTVRAAYRWDQAAAAIERMATSAWQTGRVVLTPHEPVVRLPQVVRQVPLGVR
jgi:glycosyltransferase involved in cell wall biosynthesis